jgi:hypothetical protein
MIPVPVLVLILLVALLIYFIHRIVTQRPKTRTKDLLVYFLIVPLVIAALIGLLIYLDIDEKVQAKWTNISATAAYVFGLTVRRFWQYRQKWTFWCGLGGLVVAHFIIWQRLYWEMPGYFWLMLVVGLSEMFVVFLLMGLMLGTNTRGDVPPVVR